MKKITCYIQQFSINLCCYLIKNELFYNHDLDYFLLMKYKHFQLILLLIIIFKDQKLSNKTCIFPIFMYRKIDRNYDGGVRVRLTYSFVDKNYLPVHYLIVLVHYSILPRSIKTVSFTIRKRAVNVVKNGAFTAVSVYLWIQYG
jgi:hypothetical protein